MKTRSLVMILLAALLANAGCSKITECYKEYKDALQRKEYRKCIEEQYETAIRLIDDEITNFDADEKGYYDCLLWKADLIMLHKERNDQYKDEDVYINSSDSDTRKALKYYKEIFDFGKDVVLNGFDSMSVQEREYNWMYLRPFFTNCYRTEAADPAFLYDVTLFSKGRLMEYSRQGKAALCTWEDVQQKLQPDECAVEFIQYEKYGEEHMGALVLKSEGEPRFVWLGYSENIMHLKPNDSVKFIEKVMPKDPSYEIYGFEDFKNYFDKAELMLKGEGFDLYDAVNCGNGVFDSYVIDCIYNDSTIFKRVWKEKLLKAIGKDTRRLYFAADGIYNVVPIEYMLPCDPELTSLKSENLYRLTSTRQLLMPSPQISEGKLLLVGDIDYDAPLDEPSEKYANDENAFLFAKFRDASYPSLEFTSAEVEEIRKAYDSTKTTVLTGSQATETSVVSMIKQHSIVHIATYGAYSGIVIEDATPSAVGFNESFSKSCIVLAGCNTALKKEGFDPTACPDGFLSAREIAQMDFSNVDLMVLSAGRTGLGYLSEDGVCGLQRGLKYAGVKSMILGLWGPDDEVVSDMMQRFYEYLQVENVHDAFMHAREELVKSGLYDNPYYYNSFVLIDVK